VVGDVVSVLPHEHAEQAVTRLDPLLLHDAEQVLHRLRDRAERAGDPAEEVETGGAQPLEVGAVGVGDAEELADRQRGDGEREGLQEIDDAVRLGERGHLVELADDDGLDSGRKPA
jgi:hypothetical protein